MDVITRGFRRFCVNKSERERERGRDKSNRRWSARNIVDTVQ